MNRPLHPFEQAWRESQLPAWKRTDLGASAATPPAPAPAPAAARARIRAPQPARQVPPPAQLQKPQGANGLPLDVWLALLAVALVVAAFVLSNWGALADQPSDAQAAADTAASVQDAMAAARVARLGD